jgi:hypothetical protein
MDQQIIKYAKILLKDYLEEFFNIGDDIPKDLKCDKIMLKINLNEQYSNFIGFIKGLIVSEKSYINMYITKSEYLYEIGECKSDMNHDICYNFIEYFRFINNIIYATIRKNDFFGHINFKIKMESTNLKYNKLLLQKYHSLFIENHKFIKSSAPITSFAKSLLCLYLFDFDYNKITNEVQLHIDDYFKN